MHKLVQDWIDADPGNTIGVLARRAGMNRNTIYAVIRDGAGMPRKATMEKLARGLGIPLQVVRDAAAEAAGFRVEDVEGLDPEMRGWVAMLQEIPSERRAELADIARIYLRRAKEAP